MVQGTEGYMAPEINETGYHSGFYSDLFSAGVTLFIMIKGAAPFEEASQFDPFYKAIIRGRTDLFWKKHEQTKGFSDDLKDLLIKIFNHEAYERPSFEQIIEHPWMNGKMLT